MNWTPPLLSVAVAMSPIVTNAQTLPKLGTAVSGLASRVGAWRIASRHNWCQSSDPIACPMLELRSGESAAIALTHVASSDSLGGIDAEIVDLVFPVSAPSGVQLAECKSINERPAVLGWLDRRTRVATIFTTDGKSLFRSHVRYREGDEPCETGED
jgi:hypothetical protein